MDDHTEELKEQLKKERIRRGKAEAELKTQTRMNAMVLESDIKEWPFLSVCDKKILAVLYWNKLSTSQQKEFDDIPFKEIEETSKKFRHDIMSDPVRLKQYFLKHSFPILNQIIEGASSTTNKVNLSYETREVWEVLKGMITAASDPAPLMNLKGKSIEDQIDEILSNLTQQKITINEAKELMSLVSSGFNLQQLPKLMQKLEALEGA